MGKVKSGYKRVHTGLGAGGPEFSDVKLEADVTYLDAVIKQAEADQKVAYAAAAAKADGLVLSGVTRENADCIMESDISVAIKVRIAFIKGAVALINITATRLA